MPQAPSRERTGPDTHRDKANADIEAWGKVFLANLDTSAEASFLPPPAGPTVPVSDAMSSIRVQLCPADADGPAVDCFMIDIWRKLSAMLPSTPLQQQTPVTTASAATGTFHVQLLRVCVLLECIREQHVASVSSSCDPRALLTFQEALKNLLLLANPGYYRPLVSPPPPLPADENLTVLFPQLAPNDATAQHFSRAR